MEIYLYYIGRASYNLTSSLHYASPLRIVRILGLKARTCDKYDNRLSLPPFIATRPATVTNILVSTKDFVSSTELRSVDTPEAVISAAAHDPPEVSASGGPLAGHPAVPLPQGQAAPGAPAGPRAAQDPVCVCDLP